MKTNKFLVLVTLLGLAACGSDSGGGSGSSKGKNGNVAREMSAATPGTYYTVLRPVNFHANGFIPYGAATFTLQNDQLQVSISMDDDQAVTHRQSLHLGSRCPTLSDDSNGDGFIDYDEAMRVVGPVVVPLDSDLNSQSGGAEAYPRGPGMTYNKIASLDKMNADLWKKDENPADNMIKLSSGKGVGFEGRVILVHGTTNQNSFPASLASREGEAAHISLPVVCGVMSKID